jgi:hypothetical protein
MRERGELGKGVLVRERVDLMGRGVVFTVLEGILEVIGREVLGVLTRVRVFGLEGLCVTADFPVREVVGVVYFAIAKVLAIKSRIPDVMKLLVRIL